MSDDDSSFGSDFSDPSSSDNEVELFAAISPEPSTVVSSSSVQKKSARNFIVNRVTQEREAHPKKVSLDASDIYEIQNEIDAASIRAAPKPKLTKPKKKKVIKAKLRKSQSIPSEKEVGAMLRSDPQNVVALALATMQKVRKLPPEEELAKLYNEERELAARIRSLEKRLASTRERHKIVSRRLKSVSAKFVTLGK